MNAIQGHWMHRWQEFQASQHPAKKERQQGTCHPVRETCDRDMILPSGKLTVCFGKSPFLRGKSTINVRFKGRTTMDYHWIITASSSKQQIIEIPSVNQLTIV